MTRNISAGLKTYYASGTRTDATCWQVVLTDGTTIRATSLDHNIEFPVGSGNIYLATSAYTPSTISHTADLSVDNLELEGFLASPLIVEADVLSGRWDFAAVEMFEVNYKDLTLGRNLIRKGTLGEVKAGHSKFVVELRGLLQKLSKHIVKITTKDCIRDLGDAICGINLGPLTVTGSVTTATSNRLFTDTTRTEATDYFTWGLITWTGGLNSGLKMEIRRSLITGVIELQEGMPFTVQVGDTYSMYPGCLKRYDEDCGTKFNNKINFGGFPHTPLTAALNGPSSL